MVVFLRAGRYVPLYHIVRNVWLSMPPPGTVGRGGEHKRVAVIGGGLSGMVTVKVAAKRYQREEKQR